MGTGTVPPSVAEALSDMETLAGFVADVGAAEMPAEELAGHIAATERVSAVLAAALGRLLAAFDAKDGRLGNGHKTLRAWAVHALGVTPAQPGEYLALRGLARDHAVLRAALREKAIAKSLALQLARWSSAIPAGFRAEAEQILVTAALAETGCGSWRRSTPRSGPTPPRRTRTARTRTWTAACPWTSPWTGPGCCAAT